MQEKFKRLYNLIVLSRDTRNMQILGEVTKEMMTSLIESHPKLAQEFIEKLEAVEWLNYLTAQEAGDVYDLIQPQPEWNWKQWVDKTEKIKLETEEKPFYNIYALFIAMSLLDSNSRETLKELLTEDAEEDYFNAVYRLAVDQLKDKDRFFNLRDQINHKKHDTEV